MVLSQCPTSLRSRKTIRDRGENRLRKSGQNTSIVYGAGAARRRRLRASLRRPLYAVDATRHSPRRPRVRDPGHRHRQVRLLLGDRRTLNSALERSHIKKVTLHKKLVPGRARQPQLQRVHGGTFSDRVVLPYDHRPRQRPLDGASM